MKSVSYLLVLAAILIVISTWAFYHQYIGEDNSVLFINIATFVALAIAIFKIRKAYRDHDGK